ncbi:MAG TPA: hypothetical protein VKA21_04970 [Candidatus Binatia bacterium]|nr:hypothetical protein [Candidatus Binatia bacterium]
MTDATLARALADAALRAGREIRTLVHAMPQGERGRPTKSMLKPSGGYGARHVDAEAEAVGLAHLERLAARLGVGIELLLDAGAASHPIGRRDGARIVASMDVIDGTVKVAGLGAPAPDRVRLANDGGWAAAFAFTLPTRAPLAEIALGDFAVAVVVDGNPTRWPAYPQDVLALPGDAGPSTWEASEDGERRVFTTTSEDLGQLWVSLDTFQAFDRKTRRDGDDALSVALYAALVDRETGGAFDVLRQYANLSALARLLFGWREPPVWVESQGAAFVVVNENLPNLLPAVPLVAGAGGVSVDFDGRPLATRRLGEGRTSVIHAANESIALQLLARVERARSRGPWQ